MTIQLSQRQYLGVLAMVAAAAAATAMERTHNIGCMAVATSTGAQLLVEIADSSAARGAGLSRRDTMRSDGLLLLWTRPGRHPIWMADMQFDLDLLWLNEHGNVLAIVRDARRCTTNVDCRLWEPAGSDTSQAVLELPAGAAAALKLTPGTRVTSQRVACDAQVGRMGSSL